MSSGGKVSFWKFIALSDITKILIPSIQRDYAQGRADEKIGFALDRLLNDIAASLETMAPLDLNYVYGKQNGTEFVPIDGQQRLTLLLLIHIYAFAAEGKKEELRKLHCFQYHTRETTRRFLEQLIEHLPDFFCENGSEIGNFIRDSAWFVPSWVRDPSVASFLVVLEKIHKRFGEKAIADKLTTPACPITYMALSVNDMGNENDLYIKMNARGKPLTEFEIFKSDLFDFVESLVGKGLDKTFCDAFELKADTEWMSLIWEQRARSKQDGNPADRCDDYYLKLLHQLLLNHILPEQTIVKRQFVDKIADIAKDRAFYNFHDYREILEDAALKAPSIPAINKIRSTFDFLLWLDKSDKDKLKNVFDTVFDKAVRSERRESVILYSITAYASVMKQYDLVAFCRWLHVITKLVKNTEIDTDEKFCNACNAVNAIAGDCCKDPIGYFASAPAIKFFDGYQVREEILKSKLIKACSDWEPTLRQAEDDKYFDGQIGFLLRLQGIYNDSIPLDVTAHKEAVFTFEKNRGTLLQLLNENSIAEKDNLLKRALLTFGDYSIWANSSYTFFFEGGNQYFTWRRLLREETSFAVFKRFFEAYQAFGASDDGSVETWLNMCINDYVKQPDFNIIRNFKDGTGELIYNLVHVEGLFVYMEKNRFNLDVSGKRVILYQRERLSAPYAEAMSYALYCKLKAEGVEANYCFGRGYLTGDSSHPFLQSVNGEEVNIEYRGGQFYQNGSAWEINGKKVDADEDALSLLKKQVLHS